MPRALRRSSIALTSLALAIPLACGKTSEEPLAADAAADVGDATCPETDGRFAELVTDKVRVTRIDKVDLLFVIDNSSSMADKQTQLARGIPSIVKSLTQPDVDPKTSKPHTKAVADLHIGVISTSLGSHGTSACDPGSTSPHNDDHGHLLPRADYAETKGWVVASEGGVPTPAACPAPVVASALTWVYDDKRDPTAQFTGADGAVKLQTAASCVVQSVRDDGCGYEETWESMYHFLVDPQPYLTANAKCTFGPTGDDCGFSKIEMKGVDAELLAERNAFLRPDSVLSVVILSDENDFSLKPAQLDWIPWAYGAGTMFRGWKACEKVPDDFEPENGTEYADLHIRFACNSCYENPADPDGNCGVPWAPDKLNADTDARNLRGFHMVQRFGFNFLWSRQRYVDAFTSPTVPTVDASGLVVATPNPVFAGGLRTPELVLVTGIVGVPQRLVADATGKPRALTEADWEKLISSDVTKRDPHMVESIAPRLGLPKFAGDRKIDDPDDPTKTGNGGERDVLEGDDLQYACIAKRATTEKSNDCTAAGAETKNPLCGPGSQPYFKAYPGLRHLRILHDLGTSALAASICSDTYSLVVPAIVDKVQSVLSNRCLKTVLAPDAAGRVDCQVFEVFEGAAVGAASSCEAVGAGYCTPGAEPCRVAGTSFPPLDAKTAASAIHVSITVRASDGSAREDDITAFEEGGNVYVRGSDGVKHLLCEERQLAGPGVDASIAKSCVHEAAFSMPAGQGGWCYSSDPAVVGDACIKVGSPGTIRHEGDVEPKDGSEVFTRCVTRSEPPGCE